MRSKQHWRDLTTVRLRKEPSAGLSDVVLASAYLPGDADIPTPELAALVEHCERQGLELIISVDSNAHHALWGSKDNNQRGEDFVSFLLATNLNVMNKGSEPTFVTSRSQTIIDLTLATEHASEYISEWHVSDDVSCSDHRWIKYNLMVTLTPPEPRRNPRKMDRGRYEIQTAQKLKSVQLPDNHEHTTAIDNHINQVTNCLITSFEQTCPLSTPKARQFHKKHWWGPELEKLRRKVRKLFNRARNTRAEHHWDAYKQAQYHYKKRIRFRKRECWRRFCTNIETNSQANRVKSILCSEPMHTLGCLKKPDGTYTKTDLETSELLITTHFPGCQIKETVTWEEELRTSPETVDWNTAKEIITHDKVIWAINSFLPYKSAGLDGIFPGLLRWSDKKLIDHLVSIYRSCLAYRYTPKVWREVKVVFIPKPGKGDYSQPKSFRPISLTSFLLKVLERLIDRELRSTTLVEQPLNPNQHAYSTGKSTDSALHKVISYIEGNLHHKISTLGAFIDIEGAFDKTKFTSISRALYKHGVNNTVAGWIDNMLKYRAIQITVNETTRGVVARGCPQGGVLSPLLWNIVIDELITLLNDRKFLTVGYADDLTILISGPFESAVCDRMRAALRVVEQWCTDHELTVNPAKTELVMFTNKRNLGNLASLALTKEVKYLGVILDNKLLWNRHLDSKINKASIILCQCKRLLGKSWGLSPKITSWLYKTIVRPIITYGAVTWWQRTELTTVKNKLQRFQRIACSAITGCMRTAPTAALEVMLGLAPLDLFIQQEAAMSAIRLKHLGLWCSQEGPHNELWSSLLCYEPLIAAPCDRTPKQHIFERKYHIQLCETERDQSGTGEVRIYTDGSKMGSGTGAGVYSQDLNIKLSITLGKHSSIFQWHSESHGNDAADELARQGSNTKVAGPTILLPLPFGQLRSWVRQRTREAHNARWANQTGCRQSKMVLTEVSPNLSSRLLSLNRIDIRIVVGTITGHMALNHQLFIMNATDSPLCRGCLVAEETAAHVILECEGVATHRANILKEIRTLREACERPRRLLSFWKELGWLN
ncbi:unnamed protein product [Euphydryas editha]|uniref:Reverse transcriptase domain-containing protein n=1 Tax=Euphydryas editha TaxID=104508 RepID=A0AAU9UEM4_EUPED|nr:unnamed protein product [Euphydryas editha]